jgi:HlyD family secretion protein
VRRLLTNPRVLIGVLVVAGLIAIVLWPSTVDVDAAVVARGSLMETIDEEGVTRVRDRFTVSAPVAGRLLRIELEPGDPVKAGDIVAQVRPETPPLLDARARSEAEAMIATARAAVGRAQADEQRSRAALAQAERDLARTEALAAGGAVAAQEVETARAAVDSAREIVNAAVYGVKAAEADLRRAEARLAPEAAAPTARAVPIRSPAAGVVLRRLRESEAVVPAGDPILEIGDPQQLEIVSDLLSTDAVRVKPEAPALIEQWGGSHVLDARVRRVEPSGFTKISALGVEEQRVNVILDFADPAGAWRALGDAYRVEVRIVTWQADAVLKVPTSALFRENARWAVYLIQDGRARLTSVEIGHQNGQEAEVRAGLGEGDEVIVHPGDTIADGTRVRVRTPADR